MRNVNFQNLKFLIGCLGLIISTQAMPYTLNDIELSDYEFNRYVKPQLISISQDYQSLLLQVNPQVSGSKPFFNIYRDLIRYKLDLEKYCLKKDVNLECQETMEKTLKTIRSGLPHLQKELTFTEQEKVEPNIMLEAFDSQSKFFNSFSALEMKTQNIYYLYLARTDVKTRIKDLTKEIEVSFIIFNDYILKSTDKKFYTEFKAFWSDFIKPVVLLILPHSDQDLFIQKINDFNLRLNFLNVVLTKRNHPITKQTKTLVTMIHNRWNNILKVSLKRQR